MKNTFFILCFILLGAHVFGQNWQIGLDLKPSFLLNTHRNKQTTLWSSESGYGFSLGIPIKKEVGEKNAIIVALDYEYNAFDNRVDNYLVSSTRLHSLNLPFVYSIGITEDWHFDLGAGLRYIFKSSYFVPGIAISIQNSINQIQPFISAGASTVLSRGSGTYELGAQIRFHCLNLWNKDYPQSAISSSNVLTFELSFRYFF